jgi:hypothetical protein
MLVLLKCAKYLLGGGHETSLGAVLAVPLTILTVNVAFA